MSYEKTYENTGTINYELFLREAGGKIWDAIKAINTFAEPFNVEPGSRPGEFSVTLIDGVPVRERELDTDLIISDDQPFDKVQMNTGQVYTSTIAYQKFLDSAVHSRFWDKFLSQVVMSLSTGIETRAIRQISEQADVTQYIGQANSDMKFVDFQDANRLHKLRNHVTDLQLIYSTYQELQSMAIAEFTGKDYAFASDAFKRGALEQSLMNYKPLQTNAVYTNFKEDITALTNGAITDVDALSIPFDGQSPDTDTVELKKGSVIQIGSELILVASVAYSSTTAGTITVHPEGRGLWGTTAATHLTDVAIDLVTSTNAMYYKGGSIYKLFADQDSYNDAGRGGRKISVTAPGSTFTLSMLFEGIEKSNGAQRVTVSCECGFKAIKTRAADDYVDGVVLCTKAT